MQPEVDLAKRIVQLLQEIIIQGAEAIYKAQQELAGPDFMERSYSGPILTFEVNDSGTLSARRVEFDIARQIAIGHPPSVREMAESWPPRQFIEIEEALGQFSYWQERLSADIEEDLYIIQKHLHPTAVLVLCRIRDYSQVFWPSPDGSVADLFRESEATGELVLRGRVRKPGDVTSCADEYNLAMNRLKREVERKKRAQFGGVPAAGSEVQLKPAAKMPAEEAKPALAEKRLEPRTQANKKSRVPNGIQKIIIRAINDGLSKDRLCEFLDLNKLPPRKGWLHDQMYTWPGSYSKAWNTKGKTANFWHRKINIYVQNIKRDFPERIKAAQSHSRPEASP
jgi:hypothetical protein